jgi:UDP-N-acetylmuramoyl-tripeptide--D-alanyl-D-alanine ligase
LDTTQFGLWLTLAALGLWVLAAARRARHLARYFQLEGYESRRYYGWFSRSKRQMRTLWAAVAGLLAAVIFSLAAPAETPALLLGIINVVMAGLFWRLQPSDGEVSQPFVPTARAKRLLIVATGVACFLAAYYLGLLALNLLGRGVANALTTAFFGLTAGLIGFLLANIALPLANLLLFPLEESKRRYFMRKAKATLQQTGATVITITGSYGKTTTKHFLQHLISARFRSQMTPKSYNTLMGISKAVNDSLANERGLDYYITEADAYFVGENASICRLVTPTIGMVMSVGPMHLERLGSMANVAAAQYEIIEALPADGVGIFNGDDPEVLKMAARGYPATRIVVSHSGAAGARFTASEIDLRADGTAFTLNDNQSGQSIRLQTPLYGPTNITNVLMAAAAAVHIGLSLSEIAARTPGLQPADHRLVRRVQPDGTVVIDDAYSANPVGTAAALAVLKLHQSSARRIVISSGMFELGARAEAENTQLGRNMASAATDVILIGEAQAKPILAGLAELGFPTDRVRVVPGLEEALGHYRAIVRPGDTLLVLTDLPDLYAR